MISCTDFIPAYSELFKYLDSRGGKAAVVAFWEYLSDNFLGNLKELVVANGIKGCWLYWSHTLNEEAADFSMELDEEAGMFRIDMYHCPSIPTAPTATSSTAACANLSATVAKWTSRTAKKPGAPWWFCASETPAASRDGTSESLADQLLHS